MLTSCCSGYSCISIRLPQILQAAFSWVSTSWIWAVADVRCRHQGCCKGVACNRIILQTNLQLLNYISRVLI